MKATYKELEKKNKELLEQSQNRVGFTIQNVLDEMDKEDRNSISFQYVIEVPVLKGIKDFWFTRDKLMKVKDKNTLMKDFIAEDKNEETPDGCGEWGNDNHYMGFN